MENNNLTNTSDVSKYFDVIKHNDLIQRTRYDLTLTEQKILLRVIQTIKPTDKEFKTVIFSIRDFCNIVGISYNGRSVNDIKRTVKNLSDKSFWLQDGQDYKLCRWVQKAIIKSGTEEIHIQLDDDLVPYLLEVKKNFTRYCYDNILPMKSKYSPRLYELLKSHEYQKELTCSVDELKDMVHANIYSQFKDVKRRVIDTSIAEINSVTDIFVKYDMLKRGRKVEGLHFLVTTRDKAMQDHYADMKERFKESYNNLENDIDISE